MVREDDILTEGEREQDFSQNPLQTSSENGGQPLAFDGYVPPAFDGGSPSQLHLTGADSVSVSASASASKPARLIAAMLLSVTAYFAVSFLIAYLGRLYVLNFMYYEQVMLAPDTVRPDFLSDFNNIVSIIANALAVAGFAVVMKKAGMLRLKPKGGAKRQLQVIGLLALVFAAFIGLELSASMLADGVFDTSGAAQMQADLLMRGNKIIMVISVALLVPLTEEFLFRGIIYGASRRLAGVGAATVISSLTFGMAHFNGWISIVTFFIGVIACVSYERTGSLLYPVGIHMVNNIAAIVPPLVLLPDEPSVLWVVGAVGVAAFCIGLWGFFKVTEGSSLGDTESKGDQVMP